MKSVIFLAPPAAGKGTFSDYLIENYNYQHISTGDLLREEAETETELKEYLKTGHLVEDDTIMNLVEKKLKKLNREQPFILDGVPRTLQQAKKLDIILNGLECHDVIVVFIDVKKEILMDRVTGRRICPNCHRSYNIRIDEYKPMIDNRCDHCGQELTARSDDNLESFEIRYQEYESNMNPIVAFYKEKGCLKVLQNNEVEKTKALENLRSILDEH